MSQESNKKESNVKHKACKEPNPLSHKIREAYPDFVPVIVYIPPHMLAELHAVADWDYKWWDDSISWAVQSGIVKYLDAMMYPGSIVVTLRYAYARKIKRWSEYNRWINASDAEWAQLVKAESSYKQYEEGYQKYAETHKQE